MTARARWALLVVASVTAAAALYARGISFDSGVAEYLPDNVPEVKAWLDSLRRFDGFNAWLVGLEEPRAGLSLEGLRHVDAVTRKLEGLKAGGVLAVRSVTNVASLREGADGAVTSEPLVAMLPTDPASLDALKTRLLGDRQVLGALVSRDVKGYALVIRADPRKDAADVAQLIERTVEAERGPLRAHYFGAPFFAAVPPAHLVAQLPWLALAFVGLLLGVLIAGTRRPRRVVTVLGAAGSSLLWWLALLRASGTTLSSSSGNAALALFALAGASLAILLESQSRRERASVVGALLALLLACLCCRFAPARFIAAFGSSMSLGLLALLALAALAILSASAAVPASEAARFPAALRVALCLATIAVGGFVLAHARLLCTPQDMFSSHDAVGESLAFFDQRFGGSDFIQVDFKGNLKDPAVAARLLRLTDLLEGSGKFADVRSVAQVLGFLNHGFGDALRIPSSHAALANVWFFLEGNGDVRNLVSDRRDEAMVMLRVPSRPRQSIATLVASVNDAVAKSADQSAAATAARLSSIARAAGMTLDPGRVAAVTEGATHAPSGADEAAIGARVAAQLRASLASPDSPYRPSDDEWAALAAALPGAPLDLPKRLASAVASMGGLTAAGMNVKFVDLLVERQRDLTLAVRSQLLTAKLWSVGASVPETLRVRAEGAVADLLDPQADSGDATVTVSGLPVVAGAIASTLKAGLLTALALILGIGSILSLLLGVRMGLRRLLIPLTATALTFIACRAAGVDLDSGSATVYLLPALLGFVASGSKRASQIFLIALGTALLTLLFTGAAPVTRVAAAASTGLFSVVLVAWFLGEGKHAETPSPVR